MSAQVTSLFRVHFVGGGKLDVEATTADQARKIAKGKQAGQISKIKRVRTS